jgi:hypothetical protein
MMLLTSGRKLEVMNGSENIVYIAYRNRDVLYITHNLSIRLIATPIFFSLGAFMHMHHCTISTRNGKCLPIGVYPCMILSVLIEFKCLVYVLLAWCAWFREKGSPCMHGLGI